MVRFLYRLARGAAMGRAASRGPAAFGRYAVRRTAYRTSGRITRSLLRIIGL